MAFSQTYLDRQRGDMLIDGAVNGGGSPPAANSQYGTMWEAFKKAAATRPPGSSPAPVAPAAEKVYAPAMIPDPVNPLAGFDPTAIGNALGTNFMQGGGDGSWSPQGMDYSGDAEFEALLKRRMSGEGVGPSWEQIVSGSYDPYARIIDRQTAFAQDQSVEGMISRGMLDSGEARKAHSEIGLDALDRKNAFLGQLGMQHETLKQEGINTALNQFGIIEGNKLSAKATITSANIGAAATVKSSAIQAGATREAALISAQARLQEANLDAGVALAGLRQDMEKWAAGEGIDLHRWQTDPIYRGVQIGIQREWKMEEAELIRLENDRRRGENAMGPGPG